MSCRLFTSAAGRAPPPVIVHSTLRPQLQRAEPAAAPGAQPIIKFVTPESAAYLCAKTPLLPHLTWTVPRWRKSDEIWWGYYFPVHIFLRRREEAAERSWVKVSPAKVRLFQQENNNSSSSKDDQVTRGFALLSVLYALPYLFMLSAL